MTGKEIRSGYRTVARGISVVEVTSSATRELLLVKVLKAAGFNTSDNWKPHCMNAFFYKHVLLFSLNTSNISFV